MNSGSLGNLTALVTDELNDNQVIPISRARTKSINPTDSASIAACSNGKCEVSWKPVPTKAAQPPQVAE